MHEGILGLLNQADTLTVQMRMAARDMPDDSLKLELRSCADTIGAAHTRVRAEMLRHEAFTARELIVEAGPRTIGELHIDPPTRQVTIGGRLLELTKMEFSLLLHISGEPHRVFTKEELLRDVWGWEHGGVAKATTRTLDSHACRLRTAMGGPPWISNVWGVGYRLIEHGALVKRPLELVS
jgi:DNA-binding response OmpR family regulator